MSCFEHPKPVEIRHYEQLASWLRELIVSGQIALGDRAAGGAPEIYGAAITVLHA